MKYQVVAQAAAGYRQNAVFVYLVDIDGDESSTNDRELFMMVYDFEKDNAGPPIRLTNNDLMENNIVITDLADGLRLYYSEDGSITCLKISDIIDKAIEIPMEYNGVLCTALIENRMPAYFTNALTVLEKQTPDGNNGSGVRYDTFTLDWSDNLEYIFFTQPGLTYADGINAEDPEAALPENQFAERQLYLMFHGVFPYEEGICDENGNPMTYPEFTDSGAPIDYNTVKDALGNVGKVKAGDPVMVLTYDEEYYPEMRITDEKGANIISQDSIFDGEFVNSVYVKAYSELTDVDGVMVPVASEKDRKLMLARFDPYAFSSFKYELEASIVDIDDILYSGDTYELKLSVTNPNLVSGDLIYIRIYQNDGTGNYVLTDETTTGSLSCGETKLFSVPMTLPDDLRKLDFRVEFVEAYELGGVMEEDILATAEYRYTQPADAMNILSFKKDFLSRDRLLYEITVENPFNVKLENELLGVQIGESMIVKGISDTEFAPDSVITREQMMTVLYRYAQYLKLSTAISDDSDFEFDDIETVSDWALEAVLYCTDKGIILGDENGNINPSDTATRAQFAAVLLRSRPTLSEASASR